MPSKFFFVHETPHLYGKKLKKTTYAKKSRFGAQHSALCPQQTISTPMKSKTKSQIKCYNDYFSKKDDGTWGPLLNSTLPHWTLMGTWQMMGHDGLIKVLQPRPGAKDNLIEAARHFLKSTEMWWKTAQRHQPLMTSLRAWRWNELNDDDAPAVTLGEGRIVSKGPYSCWTLSAGRPLYAQVQPIRLCEEHCPAERWTYGHFYMVIELLYSEMSAGHPAECLWPSQRLFSFLWSNKMQPYKKCAHLLSAMLCFHFTKTLKMKTNHTVRNQPQK